MEAKVAVLGDADFVMPFSALGLDTFAVEADIESVRKNTEKILKLQYGLIVVAENVAVLAKELFEKTEKKATTCVLVVPFTTDSQGFATKALGQLLKMATGINILEN